MQLSEIPGKLVLPWATAGNKNSIPVASQIGITAGAASLYDGFPPLTMTPVAAGGVPPSGLDMNGILYEMSNILRWANAGGGYAYDPTFANDSHVGGYPKGARVMRSDGMGYWFNTVDNNTTDPEAAGAAAAGWVPDYQAGATSVAMSGSSVTLTPAQYGKPLIVITGALSANLNLIFPALAQGWTIINNTTGGYSITAKTASGSGVTLGTISQIVGDGTNIYAANPDSVQIVTNVATLRNIAPTLSRRIQTRGYYTDGDGGGAQYFPKVGAGAGTYVDNGGTVIVPTGGNGSAAWLLDITENVIYPEQFGVKGDGVTDDSVPFNAATDYAITSGYPVICGPKKYIAAITTPPASAAQPLGYVLTLVGAGAANGFLGDPYINGTRIVSPSDTPAFTYVNRLASSNAASGHVYVRGIRFEATTTAAPVVSFQRFSDYSVLQECEIRQHGAGNGLVFDHAYGGTVQNVHVMNDSLVGGTPTGTGVSVSAAATLSGALLLLNKITSRGWVDGFTVGSATGGSNLQCRIVQAECSTVTNGIKVASGVRGLSIESPYFEAVTGKCIDDQGWGTKVLGGYFFVGAMGIDGSYNTYGNVYKDNYFVISAANTTGIAVYSSADALGYKKIVKDNFLYFTTSGGSLANVVGIALTGANPVVDISGNTFRPHREWVGGAGTKKISFGHTGQIIGVVQVTDSLNEFQVYSNSIYAPASGAVYTESSVTGGVLALGVGGTFDINFSAPTNINSFTFTGPQQQMVIFRVYNANATFISSSTMRLAGNFTGSGVLCGYTQVIAGTTYFFEISRSSHS